MNAMEKKFKELEVKSKKAEHEAKKVKEQSHNAAVSLRKAKKLTCRKPAKGGIICNKGKNSRGWKDNK